MNDDLTVEEKCEYLFLGFVKILSPEYAQFSAAESRRFNQLSKKLQKYATRNKPE